MKNRRRHHAVTVVSRRRDAAVVRAWPARGACVTAVVPGI